MYKFGKSPCPRQAEFWRLGRVLTRSLQKIGAAAGNCTRTSSVAGGILAIKSQPRKIERAGRVLTLPALRHFNKEQTPLGDRFDPNPRFHGGCFGVRGTPPPKPLNCKTRFALPGCAIEPSRAHHAGDDSKLVLVKLGFAPEDII